MSMLCPVRITVVEEPANRIFVEEQPPIYVKVVEEATVVLKVFEGAKGADGPTGPPGPTGAPGSAGGFAVVTASTNIPLGQNFTLVNASFASTQTLPLISSIISGSMTNTYTVANLTTQTVAVVASGGDAILVGTPVLEPFKNTSFTFLATPLGWVVL